MKNFSLNISGEEIPVSVEEHKRFKRCSMRVNESGLKVTIPLYYQEKDWREFINKHRPWILRTYLEHKGNREKLPKLKRGEKIPFRGNFYTLTESSVAKINFSDAHLLVPPELLEESKADQLIEELFFLYIEEAEQLLMWLIKKWHSHLIGNIHTIKLKEMRSRWGSCSSNGTIAMNWRLVMAPDEVFEYVFVHELCHIEVQAHNRSFWYEVDKKFPGAEIWRRLLKKDNYRLMNFPFPVRSPKTLGVIKII